MKISRIASSEMIDEVVDELLFIYCPEEKHQEEWDMKGLKDSVYGLFSIMPDISPMNLDLLRETLISEIKTCIRKEGIRNWQ